MEAKFTRGLSAFLAALLLGAVGCGSTGQTPEPPDQETSDSQSSVTETEDASRAKDSLPATDFEGRAFGILIKDEMSYEFDPENTSETLSDTVHKRNRSIESRFNCKLNYIHEPGAWASLETFQARISNAVNSDDKIFDIVTGQSNILMPLAVQGMYNNVADAKYIDFDQPYWKSGYHENAMINGKLFTLCGDFALTTFSCSNVLFFNKKLFTDNGMEFPYETVKAGKWTLDEFLRLIADKAVDLDGNSKIDKEDQHGFGSWVTEMLPFFVSTGLHMTVPDGNGRRVQDFPSEQAVDVFDKLFDLYHSDDMTALENLDDISAFKDGKLFMMSSTLKTVEQLRDMNVDFGIVPFPKYDENQENYRTSVLRIYTTAAIPKSAEDPEKSGFILEALACEGYNSIVPAYTEKALNGKYFRDEESTEMLEIVNNTTFLEFTDVFYLDLEGASDYLVEYILERKPGLVSKWKRKSKAFDANLEKLYNNFGGAG